MRAFALCPEITTTRKMELMFPSGAPSGGTLAQRLEALRRPLAIDIKRYATGALDRVVEMTSIRRRNSRTHVAK